MTTRDKGQRPDDDAIEMLLKQAMPRTAPPPEDEQQIHSSVHAAWRSVVRRRRANRRRRYLAAAAAVVAVLAAALASLRPGPVDTIDVATIDKSRGTIFVLGDRSELIELSVPGRIRAGEILQTGSDAALGLAWHEGGSLRVDENTRIEFIDDGSVRLHRGRIYFDAGPEGSSSRLVVDTAHGSLRHIGTQYMAAVDAEHLEVSVREGSVQIDGRFYERTAFAGKQVRFRGSARPVVVEIAPHGGAWTWAESVAPGIDLDDRSALEFLRWVGRETGCEIVFDDGDAERLAESTMLRGRVEAEPRTELRLRMATTDLRYTYDAASGTIMVSLADGGGL